MFGQLNVVMYCCHVQGDPYDHTLGTCYVSIAELSVEL